MSLGSLTRQDSDLKLCVRINTPMQYTVNFNNFKKDNFQFNFKKKILSLLKT